MRFASVHAWAFTAKVHATRQQRDLLRAIPVLLFGLIGLFVIGAMAAGYIMGGSRTPLGVARQTSTGHLVEMDSRMLAGGDYVLLSVTPAGALQGFAAGQTIDMTDWSLKEKLAFAYPSPRSVAKGAELRLHHMDLAGQQISQYRRHYLVIHGLEIVVRLVLLGSSLCILQFARGWPAISAGFYLGFAAMADSPITSFAGLPEPIQVTGVIIATCARPAAYIARVCFAMMLFPGSRALKQGFGAGFAVLLGVLCIMILGHLATILFNAPVLPVSPLLLPILQCLTQAASLVLFGIAAVRADAANRFALRVIFVSTFVTLFSFMVQEVYIIAGVMPPAWMFWYFATSLLGAGIGYLWAIFSRRIAGVDFIISRSVAYVISVALIFGIIELAEHLLDGLSGDWHRDEILIYGIPLAVTLSMSWFQTRMTTLVGFLLDGDLRHLERSLRRLRERLPLLGDLPALAEEVSYEVAAALHMREATLYARGDDGLFRMLTPPHHALPAGDPALRDVSGDLSGDLSKVAPVELEILESQLQAGLLFPLIVFGQCVGLLHCGARPHNKGYDRVERQMLQELAGHMAIAMVWLDPRWRVPGGPRA
jgi:GAF domain-containing protein